MRVDEPEEDVLASVPVIRPVVIRVTARLSRDVLHSQGPANQNLRLGAKRLPLDLSAIPA